MEEEKYIAVIIFQAYIVNIKNSKRKMMVNDSTTTDVILVDPFGGNVSMNILVSFAYTLSLGCSLFLFWFSWIERMNSFSNFRPVTQQLVSFCLVLVSLTSLSMLKKYVLD